ncbi:Alpha-1,2-mannosyltransferase [Phytophthora fragariae]|uniref:Mannosyltransferase n=1 Tax=Phytophthora fragariae TaxID=53985 RepID=A0A6A3X6M8_9STRA|nr:Alpha-1,2-mannosyltransferase [Phytophthora fragariae]KAE9025188.1 Alpha-1,2-mannosyltransferase [Phytophthora fragariae]KAE9093305.1 Alpha-1,2-mannosyltransferase [Phytophthora fragariae]KAE9093517.1 Alpha-1,2-mannosyltransferase [Phytophthora fragariae]KAE9124588.1 Alpha-1,2-mannosyltransferase [Phytophthora fragariae]
MPARRVTKSEAKASAAAAAQVRNEQMDERLLWLPSLQTALSLLVLPRAVSALLSPIADCDETFNYWEPLHYLLYRFGFQTWEYSPVYALRSYFYLLLHYVVVKLTAFGSTLGLLADQKLLLFYGLRAALALLSAYAEALFYQSTSRRFGRRTARYLLWILLFNAGVFHASTAFLPSTFTMVLLMLFASAWMDKNHYLALFWGVVAVLCGWPYVGVLFIPFAVETLYTRGLIKSILVGAGIGGVVLAVELVVNFHYYQRWVLPAWNIVVYNVLSNETDSTLYGTEPLSYYLLNLALNFNVVALLAAPAVLFAFVLPSHYETGKLQLVAYLLPMYLWVAIMFTQAHKEERFLSPVYPLFCLAAAITLSAVVYRIGRFFSHARHIGNGLTQLIVVGTLGVYSLLSVSRVVSNIVNFGAPLRVYQHLYANVLPNPETGMLLNAPNAATPTVNLCLLKEWYRFPTSFFIPSNSTKVQFVKSSFSGLLPKPFEEHENGTSIIPGTMNDQNREEPSRYVPIETCDYVVDLNLPGQQETKFWEEPATWELVHSEPFLDAERSKSPYRSFYIPMLTPQYVKYADYAIYKRKKTAAN